MGGLIFGDAARREAKERSARIKKEWAETMAHAMTCPWERSDNPDNGKVVQKTLFPIDTEVQS